MSKDVAKAEWARKVPRHKIRQLYRSDARGILDEDRVDDVAYRFYARCAYLLALAKAGAEEGVTAWRGRVVQRPPRWDGFVKLARYPWEISRYEAFADTGLLAEGRTAALLAYFVERLPAARPPREKMLLINRLVHECHESLKAPGPAARPLAVELITGARSQIRALLDELACGARSMPGDAP
jgi:hypothetical protein